MAVNCVPGPEKAMHTQWNYAQTRECEGPWVTPRAGSCRLAIDKGAMCMSVNTSPFLPFQLRHNCVVARVAAERSVSRSRAHCCP